MFYYKQAKTKSNYLQIPLTLGKDYQSNNKRLQLNQTQVMLTLPLFGKDQIATVSYPAGMLDRAEVTGEVVLNYTLQDNQLQVCAHDFSAKGYLPLEHYHTKPFFQLTKTTEDNDQASEPLLKVSSDRALDAVSAENNELFDDTVINSVREQLRGIYDELEKELENTDYGLSVCLDELLNVDDDGQVVGATYVNNVNFSKYSLFLNVEGSSSSSVTGEPADNFPHTYHSWLKLYADGTGITENQAKFCASKNISLVCTIDNSAITGRHPYVGGHVLLTSSPYVKPGASPSFKQYYNSGLSRAKHQVPEAYPPVSKQCVYDQTFVYYLIPICSQHNNTNNYDVLMQNDEARKIIKLNGFKSNWKHA